MKKVITVLLLLSTLSFAQIADSTHIDASAAKTDSLNIGMGFSVSAVVVDTPWTDSNLGFEVYDGKLKKWCEVTDEDGNAIELTVGAITKPTKVKVPPTEALAIGYRFKLVSQVSNVDSNQAAERKLSYEKVRLTER